MLTQKTQKIAHEAQIEGISFRKYQGIHAIIQRDKNNIRDIFKLNNLYIIKEKI